MTHSFIILYINVNNVIPINNKCLFFLFFLYRVDYVEVYIHPFFWTWAKRLEFLQYISDFLLWVQTEFPDKGLIETINAIKIEDWKDKIDPDWKKAMIEGAKYQDNTCSFLQLVRNTIHHIRQKRFFNGGRV